MMPPTADAAGPLRILMTDPHLKGGGQVRYVSNLATAFTAMGHQVIIGCKPGSVLVESARDAGCDVADVFPFRGGLRPRAWWADVSGMKRVIRDWKPDVVHVSGSQDHWSAAIALGTLGRKTCLIRSRHNTYTVANHGPNRILNYDWTDYQICVCEWVREQLADQSAFDEERLCSIHNGVDADAYKPDANARSDARREFGFDPSDIVVGIAARMVEDKGHRFLIEAVASLRESIPSLRFLMLGQGPLEEQLSTMVRDRGLESVTTIPGFRNDMARCVQAFDIGVQPSIDCDTSSFSLKEQMAAGKPVIASDHGGLPEIVDDGVDGYVVPAGTVEPIAQAIRKLADDPDLRSRMGSAGREHVLREFTVQIFAERTIDAYRNAMAIHRERVAS